MSEIPSENFDIEVGWARVAELFHAALEQPPDCREDWIGEETRHDARLHAEVLSLLDALARHEELSRVCSRLPTPDNDPAQRLVGQLCGSYRLERLIGTGGMAWVYEATRVSGEFHQRLAVKVLPAPFGGAMLDRFRLEKSILAGLNHPGIAHLLDGGITENGISYLAMEFVEGVPITSYAKSRNLGLGDRMRLLQSACEAVQFAHEHRVVHRDIKPSNLLVTAAGEIKLLDFGIARLMDEGSAGQATVWRALTPKYASPEQLRGEAAGVPGDVYQFGVLMRELMEDLEPPDPDLESIAAKATQTAPEERYASVAQLADDLARHQHGWPVQARPGNFGYRCSRFVKRHRHLLSALALLGVLQAAVLFSFMREHSLRKAESGRLLYDTETVLNQLNRMIADRDTRLRSPELNASMAYLERAYSQNPDDIRLISVLHAAYTSLAQRAWFRYLPSLMDLQEGDRAWSRVRDFSSIVRKHYQEFEHAEGLNAEFQHTEIQIEFGQGLQSFKEAARLLTDYRQLITGSTEDLAQMGALCDMLSDRLGANTRWSGDALRIQGIRAHEASDALARAAYVSALRSSSSNTDKLFPENGSEKAEAIALVELHLGELQCRSGAHAEGEQTLRSSISALQSMRKNGMELLDLSAGRGFFELGRALRNSGRNAEALDALRQADEILSPRWGRDSDSVYLRERLGEVRLESGQALLGLGRQREARRIASEGLHLLRQNAEMKGAPTFCVDLAAQRLLTVEPVELRDAAAALLYAQQAVAQTNSQMPAYLVTLATAQYANGRKAEARSTEIKAAISYEQVWAALQPMFHDAAIATASERYAEIQREFDRLVLPEEIARPHSSLRLSATAER